MPHCKRTGREFRTLEPFLFDYKAQAPDHTGGRLKVGPDRLLYLSTGDHDTPATAQDLTSMNGKVLRMNLNGTPAAGNPFPANPFVCALRFRDPLRLPFDSSGQLYELITAPRQTTRSTSYSPEATMLAHLRGRLQ